MRLMAGKIKIDAERCKGCGLCITVCPKSSIATSNQSNKKGYFPAQVINTDCTGCAMCAIICPDAVIEVYRDETIVAVEVGSEKKTELSEEKV
jgi:2-oxoglutarate ferredoxin oxidoreductase subunit delta